MPASIWIFVKKVQQLFDSDWVEHIFYYVNSAGFELLDDVILTQLKSICSRYQEGYITVCQLLKNLVFHLLHLIIYKDW